MNLWKKGLGDWLGGILPPNEKPVPAVLLPPNKPSLRGLPLNPVLPPLSGILNADPAVWGVFPSVKADVWGEPPNLDNVLRGDPKWNDGETPVDWKASLHRMLPKVGEFLEYPFEDYTLLGLLNKLGILSILNPPNIWNICSFLIRPGEKFG